MDLCAATPPELISERQSWWHPDFVPVETETIEDFNVFMGHEVAMAIRASREAGRKLVLILPVGPMGMYRWTVYFLREWRVGADHVYGFNMDEWADAQGNTVPASHPGSFQNAMEAAFYGPLADLTIPAAQRHFATRTGLPSYADKIGALSDKGADIVVVFGVGRVCHIAFWEPHFAEEFSSVDEWSRQSHRLGARLHPLTIEQNAVTSFKSRTTLVPAYANTIGPGDFLEGDENHRRLRWSAGAGNAVAGIQSGGYSSLWAGHMGALDLHADSSRQTLLFERAGRPVGGRVQLTPV
jgi:glucosamine-6-phosphate deaminase